MKDLYYVLMYNKLGNAKQCKTLIKHGNIEINGHVVSNPYYQVHYKDHLTYQNQELQAQPFFYYMLNKPKGYLCANHDQKEKCVVELPPPFLSREGEKREVHLPLFRNPWSKRKGGREDGRSLF